jgi:protein-S-isoprenylcysteine O-methyltransferase Ste14
MVILVYAFLAYATFLTSIAWAISFLTGPDDRHATHPAWAALTVDGILLIAFAAQHTVMARARFKRLIPAAVERSTFVLAASLLMLALLACWQPVPARTWTVGRPWSALLWSLYAAGWALVIASTYMIDHADLFGLKQAWLRYHHRDYEPPVFQERRLYTWCRHPMMLGMLIAFWATPRMTAGHLFFAVASTGYIAIGIRFEEHDLHKQLGPDYSAYTRRVPMLIPRLRPPRDQPRGGEATRTGNVRSG